MTAELLPPTLIDHVPWRLQVELVPDLRRVSTRLSYQHHYKSSRPEIASHFFALDPNYNFLRRIGRFVANFIQVKMADEYDEAQAGDDGGMTGPGAPTPLTALEVIYLILYAI